MSTHFAPTRVSLTVQQVPVDVSAIHRPGDLAPIVFMHGFGSTKEDYADVVLQPAFDGHAFLAWDAPGCGDTRCDDLSRVNVPFQIDVARATIDAFGIDRFHLVGHSMGGLGALLLAHALPARVLSLTSIEGNVAPEDCFLSRQIVEHAHDDAEVFFSRFVERAHAAPAYASALYAASLRHKVRAQAVAGIFRSMVTLSDHGDLLGKWLSLPCPTMFMYGAQNAHLSYLPRLRAHGTRLAEIADCGHFPMYSNPVAMWAALAAFVSGVAPRDA